MAGKITIRRIGSKIPTLLFLLFVLACVLIVWLTVCGAPDFALRYIERKAAEQGICLKLGSLSFSPSRGVAVSATDIQVYAAPGEETPVLTIPTASAGLSLSYLLMGHIHPKFLSIADGTLRVAVTHPAGKYMELKGLSFSARMEPSGRIQLSSCHGQLQGIHINLQGGYDPQAFTSRGTGQPQVKKEAKAAPPPAPSVFDRLAEHQELINRIYHYIERQHWQADDAPVLNIGFDISRQLRVVLHSSIPRFDLGQFHFRNAVLDSTYANRIVTINNLKFDTIDPDASASFQGAYDIEKRHLSFATQSTVALVRMVRFMSHGPLKEYLFKFRHPDDAPPRITLGGDIILEEDFSPHSIKVRGTINQDNLLIGATKINELSVAFVYNDGNFNIDRLRLIFPDGSLQASAGAANGKGSASLSVDLPVQKMLTLAGELSSGSISLPAGFTIGERLNLTLHTNLTAPEFIPGRNEWQGFVPTLQNIKLTLQTDRLAYADWVITEPLLSVDASVNSQGENLLPRELDVTESTLKAKQIAYAPGSAAALTLHAPELHAAAQTLQLDEQALPHFLKGADLSFSAEQIAMCREGAHDISAHVPRLHLTAQELEFAPGQPLPCRLAGAQILLDLGASEYRGARQASLSAFHLDTALQDLSFSGGAPASPDSLVIGSARAETQAEQVQLDSLQIGSLQLRLSDVLRLSPLSYAHSGFGGAALSLSARSLVSGETPLGNVELSAHLREGSKGSLSLHSDLPDSESLCSLSVDTDWTNPHAIELNNIQADMPAAMLTLLKKLLSVDTPWLEVQDHLSLKGRCVLDSAPLCLRYATLELQAPQLVRTPYLQPALSGKRIPLSLTGSATLRSDGAGSPLRYDGRLLLRHTTGLLDATVEGTTAGQVHITGSNTIRPDIVDQLIDSADAHYIIRDFRFSSGSKISVTDIDVNIDYARGLQVSSDCQVELKNAEYLISSIVDSPRGERLRTDLGSSPHSFVYSASCGVHVRVSRGGTRPDGSPRPEESAITLSNPKLHYNNDPWLKRANIQGGARSSTLRGDEIVIDIGRGFVKLKNLRGTVYPAYALGMFYPALYGHMKDVQMKQPVELQTPQCVFPIYSNCKQPMTGTIRVLAPSGASFRFLGTTIPLDGFSGFIYITDNYVLLDRMNARCWEGVLDAAVKIGITGSHSSFDGYAKAQCMNLRSIAAAYNSTQKPALCNGEIRFRTPTSNLKDLQAYGSISIEDGDLMQLSLFHPISDLITNLPTHFSLLEKQAAAADGSPEQEPGVISRIFTGTFYQLGNAVGKTTDGITTTTTYIPGLNHIFAYSLQSAHAPFEIAHGHLISRNMKAKGYNLNVHLNLDIDLDTMQLRGNLWPRISSLPTLLLAPLTFLSNYMVDINVYGPINNIQWSIGLDMRLPGQPSSASSTPDPEASHSAAKKN